MKTTPSPNKYTKEHFLIEVHGHEEFSSGKIPAFHRLALGYLSPRPNEVILDVGCGRGEIVKECHRIGAVAIGVDFSEAAMGISKELIGAGILLRANATSLPFSDGVFDKVVLLDIVEHLDELDLTTCMTEMSRVLKKDGMVLLHTPNPWHKPLTLCGLLLDDIKHLHKKSLTKEIKGIPSDIWQKYEHFEETHVNVRNPIYWRKVLSRHGFKTEVWFDRPVRSECWKTIVHRLLFFMQNIWLKGIKNVADRRQN